MYECQVIDFSLIKLILLMTTTKLKLKNPGCSICQYRHNTHTLIRQLDCITKMHPYLRKYTGSALCKIFNLLQKLKLQQEWNFKVFLRIKRDSKKNFIIFHGCSQNIDYCSGFHKISIDYKPFRISSKILRDFMGREYIEYRKCLKLFLKGYSKGVQRI